IQHSPALSFLLSWMRITLLSPIYGTFTSLPLPHAPHQRHTHRTDSYAAQLAELPAGSL
ncbi:unnamed protein product, partial [Closterium sp. Yama58-4]